MIDRRIYKSKVMCVLADLNPEMELAAQRVFEILILYADDYGRGQVLPSAIRAEAFATTPNVFAKVTNDDIVKWIKQAEKEEAVKIYTQSGQEYYELTGWEFYQRGKWYKKQSNIPQPKKSKMKESTADRRTVEPSEMAIAIVKHLFPQETAIKNINRSSRILDDLHDSDKYSWDDIKHTLKWAKTNWHWKTKFKSCASLRNTDKKGKTKFQSMIETSKGELSSLDENDKRPETGEVNL